MNNVFTGKNGLNDFLNPNNHVTPLIELPESLNPLLSDNVHLYIKMQSFLPLMNIKSLAAYNMLDAQEIAQGKTKLIESSSGNTVLSLSILGRNKGVEKTRAIVSSEVSIGKLQQLLLAGTEVQVNNEPICPNPHDKSSGIHLAKEKSKNENDWLNLNQYANIDNPKSHINNTAKQIYDQLSGDVQIFCASLGTTGTMVGCAEFFKTNNIDIFKLGVVRKPNNSVPGPRTRGLLRMIDFDWQDASDDVVASGTVESYKMSMELFRRGLMAGPSTGLIYSGLLKYLKKLKVDNALDKFRNKNGEIHSVFICCDTPFLYMDDYFKILGRECFPEIINEELLENKINFHVKNEEVQDIAVDADFLRKNYFIESDIDKNIVIVDLRTKRMFDDAHIFGSFHLSEEDILNDKEKFCADWEDKTVYFVCQYGDISMHMAKIFKSKGINSFSLKEGFVKWSELDLPREKCSI